MLSPVLFNVYFSVIVDSLEKAALGCELYDKYIGCIVYADNGILLSSSAVKLQKMFSPRSVFANLNTNERNFLFASPV